MASPEKDRLQDVLLRFPSTLRERAEEMAAREEISLNLFIATAVAEKLQRLQLERALDISDREKLPSTTLLEGRPLVH